MDTWSGDQDRENYAFGDGAYLFLHNIITDLWPNLYEASGFSCYNLLSHHKKEFESKDGQDLLTRELNVQNACAIVQAKYPSIRSGLEKTLTQLTKLTRGHQNKLKQQSEQIVGKYRCAECHGNAAYEEASPNIRFDNIDALIQQINVNPNLIDDIMSRIQLPADTKGHMPPKRKNHQKTEQLSPEEINILHTFMRSVHRPL